MSDSTVARTGPPSAAQPLFILAMDHRDSFGRTLFGVTDTADAGQLAGMRDAKELIFAGARQLTEDTAAPGQLGILVDEQPGTEVARQARSAGFVLAMPVDQDATQARIAERYRHFIQHYLAADTAPGADIGERGEPFTYTHPRLTPDREALIRKAAARADPRGSLLPAWMTQSLLAGAGALRTGQ
jgi:Uncharacterized protein conserved in bacteria (DUF2090)